MRKKTGTVVKTKLGLWQAVITLPDGKRKRLPPFPKGTSEAMAREKAAHYAERALAITLETSGDDSPAAKWWKSFFAHREAKGLTPVLTLYVAHIRPVVGDVHPEDWTPELCERMRDSLDTKIAAGSWEREGRRYRFGWKRAWNAWALFTSACKAASRSKNKDLKVRKDNPCLGVEPPDGGSTKQKQWLYPAELLALVSCDEVPIRWRQLYALASYLYVRPNELRALQRKDVELDTGLVNVTKAWNFIKDEPKPYPKTAEGVRYVPIETSIRPLLVSLCEGLEPDDYVIASMPPAEDWAETLRRHLERAGIKRASLFEDTPTVKHITFYDLRATGITWRTLRGDDARVIQRAAGHRKYATTEGYVREASVFRGRVGEPFPHLPASIVTPNRSLFAETSGKLGVPKGIRTLRQGPETELSSADEPGPAAAPSPSEPPNPANPGEAITASDRPVGSDPVEVALADAIHRASRAEAWDTVKALTEELRARRADRAGVVSLDAARSRRGKR